MKLRAWREAQHIPQWKLGNALGVTQSTVHKYETGALIPPALRIAQIRHVTEGAVTWEDIVDDALGASGGIALGGLVRSPPDDDQGPSTSINT